MRRLRAPRGLVWVLYASLLIIGAKLFTGGFIASMFPTGEAEDHSELLHPSAMGLKEEHKSHSHPETNEKAPSPMPTPPPTTPKPTLRPLGKPVVDLTEETNEPVKLASPAEYPQEGIVERRVVHLDLKGAPMRPDYFAKLFPLLRSLGATGILMEWEDMFPFQGRLAIAVNGFAYSKDDIHSILVHAKQAGLEVIPLVQTFGHLEWILKLPEFSHLREHSKYPQVACVGKALAWELIKEAVLEVAQAHAEVAPLTFFHIGADEAFQVGHCDEDKELIQKQKSKQRFILWHIARTANFVQKRLGARVLAWHDMFASSPSSDLREYDMVNLVEPVNWNYAENLDHYMPPGIWRNLAPFPHVWGASAFKGADGPARWWSNIPHYAANHRSWLSQIVRAKSSGVKDFRGIILTGWSRYDHLSCMAELFPVGFPSLAFNLDLLRRGPFVAANSRALESTSWSCS